MELIRQINEAVNMEMLHGVVMTKLQKSGAAGAKIAQELDVAYKAAGDDVAAQKAAIEAAQDKFRRSRNLALNGVGKDSTQPKTGYRRYND